MEKHDWSGPILENAISGIPQATFDRWKDDLVNWRESVQASLKRDSPLIELVDEPPQNEDQND